MRALVRAWLAALALALACGAGATGSPVARAQEAPAEQPAGLDTEAAEFVILNLLNLLRLEHGLAVLESDAALAELARLRCIDMVERGYFGHDIPGVGFGPIWLLSQLPAARGTGENLGLSDERNETAMWSLFDAWIESPTHLENLLRPEFNRVGVGVIEVPTRFPGRTLKVVAQVFAIANGPLTRR